MFKIKLSDPGRSFHDPATGLFIANDDVAEVDHLGPLTKTWIQQGGLIQLSDDDEKAPETTDQTPDQTEDTTGEDETSTQETTETPGGESEGDEEESDQEPGEEEEEEEEEEQGGGSALESILQSVTGKKSKKSKK